MAYTMVQAVVLRAVNYKDYDRILTLFSLEQGRMTVQARGCRKPLSKNLSATQPMAWGQYMLYGKGERYFLQQSKTEQLFHDWGERLDAWTHASVLIALTEASIVEQEPHPELFRLLLEALNHYYHGVLSPPLVTLYVLYHFLRLHGFAPQLECCTCCGKATRQGGLSAQRNGLVCPECRTATPDYWQCTAGHLKLLERIGQVQFGDVRDHPSLQPRLDELDDWLSRCVECRLDKTVKPLQFLRKQM